MATGPEADAAAQASPAAGVAEAPERGTTPDSLGATARRVIADTSSLIRTEATLARLETGANVRKAGSVAARALAGTALMGLALLFLVLGALVALAGAIGWLGALLLTSGTLAALGGGLIAAARRSAGQLSLLPERALGRIAGDLAGLSARLHPAESDARAGDGV